MYTFDTATDGLVQSGVGPGTVSHTTSGSNRLLVVIVDGRNSNRSTTACTYNGVSLTIANRVTDGANMYGEIWYLANPNSGANTVSVTSSGTGAWHFYVCSFNGSFPQTSPLSRIGGTTGTASSISNSVNSRAGSVIVSGLGHEDANASTPGQVSLFAIDDGTWNSGAEYFLPTVTDTKAMTWTASSSDTYAHIVAVFNDRLENRFYTSLRPAIFKPGLAR